MEAHQHQRETFRRLHGANCFVMPNPWDVGSARALEQMGFKALATTSAGFAWSRGRADTQITLDQALEHLRQIVATVAVPVNADFEGGFAIDPAQVAANVKLAVATGIAGLSIEDSTGDASHPLHDFELAVARIKAARQAIDETGAPTSPRRFAGCKRMQRPAPTACTHRGFTSEKISLQSSPLWRRNR